MKQQYFAAHYIKQKPKCLNRMRQRASTTAPSTCKQHKHNNNTGSCNEGEQDIQSTIITSIATTHAMMTHRTPAARPSILLREHNIGASKTCGNKMQHNGREKQRRGNTTEERNNENTHKPEHKSATHKSEHTKRDQGNYLGHKPFIQVISNFGHDIAPEARRSKLRTRAITCDPPIKEIRTHMLVLVPPMNFLAAPRTVIGNSAGATNEAGMITADHAERTATSHI